MDADTCEDDPVDIPLTGDAPIPVNFANSDVSDIFFHYTVDGDAEAALDPCTPLTWLELSGGNGTQEASNPTAGSSRQTVALVADGELVTEPAPILARSIDSVDRIDNSTIRVTYGFYGDAPAATGETVPGAATFHWNGSEIEVSDNTVPVELNDTAETLDLGAVTH